MFHQVRRTIDPHIRMSDVLEDWSSIAAGLAEPTRKRRPRTERYGGMCAAAEMQTKTS